MTNKTVEQQRVTRLSSKEDRERDAASAMREYEAEKAAVLAKTAKLRALRLANEAAAQADDQAAKVEAGKLAAAKIVAKELRNTKVAAKKPRAAATKSKSLKR